MKQWIPTHYILSNDDRPPAIARVLDWEPKYLPAGMVGVEAKIPGAPYGFVQGLVYTDRLIPLKE
jgi:hypothetical protein